VASRAPSPPTRRRKSRRKLSFPIIIPAKWPAANFLATRKRSAGRPGPLGTFDSLADEPVLFTDTIQRAKALARVLIVDDEEADRVVLRTILESGDHEILEANDGDEALETYRGQGIDVVVTDLQMRNVHGLELITILRDFEPRPGIIAISATGEIQLEMARALGATHALTKPIQPDDLLEAVDSVLRQRRTDPGSQEPA
jgi:CheY-like chemotaxis protein